MRIPLLPRFAGSGALGFEALSRGAKFCLFVETDEAARGAGRFVVIDPQNIMIVLQRTRRQHYNLIVRRGHAHTFSRDEIDAHWAVRGEDDADEAPRAWSILRHAGACTAPSCTLVDKQLN